MDLLSKNRSAVLAVCAVILLGGGVQDCVVLEYALYRFELGQCPDEAFSLPDSVHQGRYHVVPQMAERWAPDCPGYRIYHFLEKTKAFPPDADLTPFYVRLDRGPPCRLQVIVPFSRRFPGEPVREAELVAQLVMREAGVPPPKFPAASREELGSLKDLKEWCARTGDRTVGHPREGGAMTCR